MEKQNLQKPIDHSELYIPKNSLKKVWHENMNIRLKIAEKKRREF